MNIYIIYCSHVPMDAWRLQDFRLTEMRSLSEGICNLSLNEYQFCLGQKVLDDSRHGRMMTLGDHGITARDTLVLLKVGSTLNITNPKVYSYAVLSCARR